MGYQTKGAGLKYKTLPLTNTKVLLMNIKTLAASHEHKSAAAHEHMNAG